MRSPFLLLAGISGLTGVALGAFGAHGLKSVLSEPMMEVYKTAVTYQMWHGLALGLIAVLPAHRLLIWSGWLFATGILLFSGSLYLLAITQLKWLGMITPFGGVAFILAWSLLVCVAAKKTGDSDG